jgi:hypothetical protein
MSTNSLWTESGQPNISTDGIDIAQFYFVYDTMGTMPEDKETTKHLPFVVRKKGTRKNQMYMIFFFNSGLRVV